MGAVFDIVKKRYRLLAIAAFFLACGAAGFSAVIPWCCLSV